MKRIFVLLLAVLMLLSMVACGDNAQLEALQKENQQLKDELAALKNGAPSEPAAPAETEEQDYIYVLQATVDGYDLVPLVNTGSYTAEAVLGDSYVVDHWRINGEVVEGAADSSLTFEANDTTIVEAISRPEKTVKTVNAEMRFLNAKGKAEGDAFTEFVFEEAYTNPVTKEELPGGTITVQVKAIVPEGYDVDHWVINGVHYTFSANSFVVTELDESSEYEAVLKKVEKKEEKAVYYNVRCSYCSWNGKGNFKVKAGTKITITGNGGKIGFFYINNVQQPKTTDGKITIKVNKDMLIEWALIIN